MNATATHDTIGNPIPDPLPRSTLVEWDSGLTESGRLITRLGRVIASGIGTRPPCVGQLTEVTTDDGLATVPTSVLRSLPEPSYPVYPVGTVVTWGESYTLTVKGKAQRLPVLGVVRESGLGEAIGREGDSTRVRVVNVRTETITLHSQRLTPTGELWCPVCNQPRPVAESTRCSRCGF